MKSRKILCNFCQKTFPNKDILKSHSCSIIKNEIKVEVNDDSKVNADIIEIHTGKKVEKTMKSKKGTVASADKGKLPIQCTMCIHLETLRF